MSYEDIKERIKLHEGYRLKTYYCTENHLTGGYGHKMLDGESIPSDEAGWSKLFDKDFKIALKGAQGLIEENMISPVAFGILIEMVYQLGEYGVSKFKKMLIALDTKDYQTASVEMLDSKWAKQTPNRAEDLSSRMRNI
jgi:lysozyme